VGKEACLAARSRTWRLSRTVTRSTGALKKELSLSYVGTEGNELAHRMAMLGVQRKEKELHLYNTC
jgi:hypothetical protein